MMKNCCRHPTKPPLCGGGDDSTIISDSDDDEAWEADQDEQDDE
jgi:hypothetical protein